MLKALKRLFSSNKKQSINNNAKVKVIWIVADAFQFHINESFQN